MSLQNCINTPATGFFAYLANPVINATGGSLINLPVDTVTFDTDGAFMIAGCLYVFPKSGIYSVIASGAIGDITVGDSMGVAVNEQSGSRFIGGNIVNPTVSKVGVSSYGGSISSVVSYTSYFAAGTQINFQLFSYGEAMNSQTVLGTVSGAQVSIQMTYCGATLISSIP